VAERLRAQVGKFPFEGGSDSPGGHVTISCGVAAFPEDAGDLESLIGAADAALYAAKSAGRDRVIAASTGASVARH
jgi:diguanylate cyclase (GGDEF)-like protein